MQAQHFAYSGFLRGPSSVLPAVEQGDVILERRDGDDLVLSTAARSAARREGLDVGAAALRAIARTHADLLAEALREGQPWISWLPTDDQEACVRELTDDLAAGVSSDSFVRFQSDLAAWRHTAEVWADPDLVERLLTDSAEDAGQVLRPSDW